MYTAQTWQKPGHYYIYATVKPRHKLRNSLLWLLAFMMMPFVGWNILYLQEKGFFWRVQPNQVSAQSVSAAPAAATAQSVIDENKLPKGYKSLQPLLGKWVEGQQQGHWSVVVQDLSNPRNQAAINETDSYYGGNLYQLFMTIPLSQQIPFREWSKQKLSVDKAQVSYADCVQRMLSQANDACMIALQKRFGTKKIDTAIQKQGFQDTTYMADNQRTAPRDVAAFLSGLHRGQWFTEEAKQAIYQGLSQTTVKSDIAAGCSQCSVMHKAIDKNGAYHDAAIVMDGKNRYALVIFSRGGSAAQVSDLSKLIHRQLN